jgi:adenosine deaminase/aminodeoxyfutalosine deaminase
VSSIEQFVAGLPKAELHLHLEGAVDAETLWTLAERHQTPLFRAGRGALEEVCGTGDFTSFLEAFKLVTEHICSPEDYELIAYSVLRRLAEQNVRYAEIMTSPGVGVWKQHGPRRCMESIAAGSRRAREDYGIRVQWIFDAVRHHGVEAVRAAAEAAVALQDQGVIGFGIGGDERQAPAELFGEVFAYARAEGLRLTAHAGEAAGPESVWAALRVGAERIGHGLTAAQDPELVKHLAEVQVPLDVSVTSNVRTGCLSEAGLHPLRRYFDEGLLVTLNSDDPALFSTDLNREYLLAHRMFGFGREELTRLAENSFRAAFLPPQEKASFLAAFQGGSKPTG